MEFMKWMDNNPKWLKIVLSLGVLDLTWAIYRIINASEKKNNTALIVAVVLLLVLGFWWIVDLVTLVTQDKVLLFDDLK